MTSRQHARRTARTRKHDDDDEEEQHATRRADTDTAASSSSDEDDDDAAPPPVPSSRLAALSAGGRVLPTRADLLASISELAPQWRPYKMSAVERLQWFRIGEDNWDAQCRTSKDWLVVGRRYQNSREWESAARAFSRAIRLNPSCPAYYFRLGCVQCEQHDWSGAIESFHIAITLAPETARATYYFNLGWAHSEQRGWFEAIEALRAAIKIKPKKPTYHNLIAVCYRHATEYESSIYHYKRAISFDRIAFAYRRNLAYVYMQLKQWKKAVRAWSGAIAVAPAKNHAELYRNRAFAQAERGHLAVACEDMQSALDRYTSLQQRKRCREKLDRWTSRLQGTEQAYIREQSLLATPGNRQSSSRDRRRIKQLAGLIQGEWEEWHGEDVDLESSGTESGEDDSEDRARVKRKGGGGGGGDRFSSGAGGSSRGRGGGHSSLRPGFDSGSSSYPSGDSSSSSAHIRRLISSLGLDVPWQHRFQMEAQAEQAEREESRAAKRGRREARAARRAQREERRKERAKVHGVAALQDDTSSDSSSSSDSGESDPEPPTSPLAIAAAASSSAYAGTSTPAAAAASSAATGAAASAAAAVPGSPSASPSSVLARHASASSFSAASSSFDSYTTAGASSGGGVRDLLFDDLDGPGSDDLYAEDHLDPYSSLSKLFIRLRIDPKFLWRFELNQVCLANIHRCSEGLLQRMLPPLGPRLTLMNYLREKIVRERTKEGWVDPNATTAIGGTGRGSTLASLREGSERGGSGQDRSGNTPTEDSVAATIAEAARIQHSVSSPRRPSVRNAATLPKPLNPINPSPIVPVSPHNGVPVNRPLSARDRRILYDAKQHPQSALTPIRTFGSMNWK